MPLVAVVAEPISAQNTCAESNHQFIVMCRVVERIGKDQVSEHQRYADQRRCQKSKFEAIDVYECTCKPRISLGSLIAISQ